MFGQYLRKTAIAAIIISIAACSSDTTMPHPAPIGSLTILGPSATVYEADAVVLTAVFRDGNGVVIPNAPISWSIQDTTYVLQSTNGNFLALRSGVAKLTATSADLTASYDLLIVRPPVLAVNVLLPTPTLFQGEVASVGVRADGPGGRVVLGRDAILTSNNPNVAFVDASGRVRGVNAGTTAIRAVVDGVIGLAQVTVTAGPTQLVLSKYNGASLPMLIVGDSVHWDGRAEYHEYYVEAGTFSLSGNTPLRYATDLRHAEYNVTVENGQRRLELRAVFHERDVGLVAYDTRGDLLLTSEVVYPLSHTAVPQTGGVNVNYRIPGTDEYLQLYFRREPL